jgi:hypothetical protein
MIPARDVLHQAYVDVIREIEQVRGSQQLTNAFYADVADKMFNACYAALENSEAAKAGLTPPKALQVVSAPMGAGKTTFAIAFITAFVRLREEHSDALCGCAFVVEQMTKAEEIFREMEPLLPHKVAVWSTDHDVNNKNPTKVLKPAKQFHIDALELHEVTIITHALHKSKGKRGRKASKVLDRNGQRVPRALTIIDEQLDDISVFDVTLLDATAVLKSVEQDERSREPAVPYVRSLVQFMSNKLSGGNLEKPLDDPTVWEDAATKLEWFTTTEAHRYEKHNSGRIVGLGAVFSFARNLVTTRAFVTRHTADTPHFVGYSNSIEPRPGTVLLDASADVDNITALCPWRTHIKLSQEPRYDNLSIVYVPCPHTKGIRNLTKYLGKAKNRYTYADWIKATILAQMEPGQRGLVVCKSELVENENVPDWPTRDPRFKTTELHQQKYGWDLEGRKLCVTYWGGYGIGVSTWRHADVVFLFHEFHRPRRVTIARTQGLLSAKATEGPLASMTNLKSRPREVELLSEGHLLRYTKQMALRGNGRNFDEHGVCGRQKVVCAGDIEQYTRIIKNAGVLFPGAKIAPVVGHGSTEERYADQLLMLLSRPDLPDTITTKWIGEQVGVPWRYWGRNVLKRPDTQRWLQSLGWHYERRGPAGWFTRTRGNVDTVVKAEAA